MNGTDLRCHALPCGRCAAVCCGVPPPPPAALRRRAKRVDGSVGEQIDCPAHVLGSARNSAVGRHRCGQIWLDPAASSCARLPHELLAALKKGTAAAAAHASDDG